MIQCSHPGCRNAIPRPLPGEVIFCSDKHRNVGGLERLPSPPTLAHPESYLVGKVIESVVTNDDGSSDDNVIVRFTDGAIWTMTAQPTDYGDGAMIEHKITEAK